MAGRLFVAWVAGPWIAFDAAVHAIGDQQWLSFEMTQTEGQTAEILVTREQTGWQQLSQDQPRSVLVSWSPTGAGADAVLMAKGELRDIPSDLFSSRQTLIIACAPTDINDRLIAYAKANLDIAPYVEKLMSDFDPEDPESYLAARADVYHVDPATHALSIMSEVEGERIVDMTAVALFGNGKSQDSAGDGGKLVRTLRARLSVAWTQTAQGICDISQAIGHIDTLDPTFSGRVQSILTATEAEGWSVGTGFAATSEKLYTDARILNVAHYRSSRLEHLNNQYSSDTILLSRDVFADALMPQHRVRVTRCPMAYDYRQDREEAIYAALELPLQTYGLESDADDIVDYAIRDIFTDPSIIEYESGREYLEGQIVRYNGFPYRCLQTHYSLGFSSLPDRKVPLPDGGVGSVALPSPSYWRRISDSWAVHPEIYSFADTATGRGVILHIMHRLRKEGLRRLRYRRVRMTFRWEDAMSLTLRDAIRFDVPWGAGETRSVVGKVISLVHRWPEAGAPIVEVEVGVSIGADYRYAPEEPAYGELDYVEPSFSAGTAYLDDIVHHTYADAISMPVFVDYLRYPFYAVSNVLVRNEAARQASVATALARKNSDPRQCSVIAPTGLKIRLKSLAPRGTLRREVDVYGQLLAAPTGVDLS